jgi:hypothetical protein
VHRWRDEAVRAGRTITRIAIAFEAGRDGIWLARWLEVRGVEAHVIHAPRSTTIRTSNISLALGEDHLRSDYGHRWDSSSKIRFAPDSPLEGDGFEPSSYPLRRRAP